MSVNRPPKDEDSSTAKVDGESRPGLRERKKLKTQRMIREEALRLFKSQGFNETTVEQIAEAAEVSPSTFFRYFPTKEAVLFSDEFDPLVIAALRSQPADKPPLRAVRDAIATAFTEMTPEDEREFLEVYRLATSTAEMRGHLYQNMLESLELFASTIAEWRGVDRQNPAVRTFVGAVVGVILEGASEWVNCDGSRPFREILDEHLRRLEEGLNF